MSMCFLGRGGLFSLASEQDSHQLCPKAEVLVMADSRSTAEN